MIRLSNLKDTTQNKMKQIKIECIFLYFYKRYVTKNFFIWVIFRRIFEAFFFFCMVLHWVVFKTNVLSCVILIWQHTFGQSSDNVITWGHYMFFSVIVVKGPNHLLLTFIAEYLSQNMSIVPLKGTLAETSIYGDMPSMK